MGLRKTQVIDITATSATVAWETDLESTTELQIWQMDSSGNFNQIDVNTVTGQGNTGITVNHIFNLINLTADTTYRVMPRSYEEAMGDYLPCDDGSIPREFTTLQAQLIPANISLTASRQKINVGENSGITAKVLDSNGAMIQGLDVEFKASGLLSWLLFWLPPIGTLNPQTVKTDVNDEAKTVFTAARKGIAVIKAVCDNITEKPTIIIS